MRKAVRAPKKCGFSPMANPFENRLVLVAGGTGGLGKAISLAFLSAGARVAVTYRAESEFQELTQAATANRQALTGYTVDVTDEAAVSSLSQKFVGDSGVPDAIVNAVGGYAGGASLWELDPKVFDRMMALNLRAGFLLLRAFIPSMLKRHTGSIVNVSSRAAVDHAGGAAAYVASKAAAVAMIDSLAEELKGTGLRANSVLPSIIDTPANRKAMPNADFAKWPKAEEIAKVILFLCSDDAALIHGASIPVYGNL